MKGILFRDWKIKAIADSSLDREWMTRRVIKPQPPEGYDYISKMEAWVKPISDIKVAMVRTAKPRYQVGEIVYIKEAFWEDSGDSYYKMDCPTMPTNMYFEKGKWKSPLFLPEIFARYFIKITDVRAERLQEITEIDAQREGVTRPPNYSLTLHYRIWFKWLWNSINKPPYDWQSNPWVWVYSFVKVEK